MPASFRSQQKNLQNRILDAYSKCLVYCHENRRLWVRSPSWWRRLRRVTQWVEYHNEKRVQYRKRVNSRISQTSNPATCNKGNTHHRKDVYAVRRNKLDIARVEQRQLIWLITRRQRSNRSRATTLQGRLKVGHQTHYLVIWVRLPAVHPLDISLTRHK